MNIKEKQNPSGGGDRAELFPEKGAEGAGRLEGELEKGKNSKS